MQGLRTRPLPMWIYAPPALGATVLLLAEKGRKWIAAWLRRNRRAIMSGEEQDPVRDIPVTEISVTIRFPPPSFHHEHDAPVCPLIVGLASALVMAETFSRRAARQFTISGMTIP